MIRLRQSPGKQPFNPQPPDVEMMYKKIRFIVPLLCVLYGFLHATIAWSHKERFLDVRIHEFSKYPDPPEVNLPEAITPGDCNCGFYNDDITRVVQKRAREISGHCGFTLDKPVYVVMEDNALKAMIDDSGSPRFVKEGDFQVLLVNGEYHFDEPVKIARDIRLCGIRSWAVANEPELIDAVDGILARVGAGASKAVPGCQANHSNASGCGSASGAGSDLPTEIIPVAHNDYLASLPQPDDDRVRIIFRSDNSDYPSLLVTRYAALRHLHLYRTGQPAGAGLLAVGCSRRDYFCPDSIVPAGIEMELAVLEDITGQSEFIMRVDQISTVYVGHSRFRFRHHAHNSKTIDIVWPDRVRLTDIEIYNIGDDGTAISWQGYNRWRDPAPSSFSEILITAPEGASMGGIRLGNAIYHLSDRNRLSLGNITFGQGIQTGFIFTDNTFQLHPNANTDNRWENSEGEHCSGQPLEGRIEFIDGTTCP